MNVFLKSPLGRKLVLTMVATSSASLLIASLSFLSYDVLTFRQNVANHLGILADLTGSSVVAALASDDPKSADLVLQSLHAEPHIMASRIYRRDGTPFATYLRDSTLKREQLPARPPLTGTSSDQKRVALSQPVTFDRAVVGYFYLESDLKELASRKSDLLSFVLLLTGACFAASFLIALLLKQVICTPILALVHTIKQVSTDKNFAIRSRKYADDELGMLVDGFNEMLGEIERRDADLKSEVLLRSRAEHTLHEREEELQLLLDSTAEGIYGINTAGECTFSNHACLQILGYSKPEQLLGKGMHKLIHHSRPDGTPYPIESCPSHLTIKIGKKMHADPEVLWRADGTSFPAEAWSHPVWSGDQLVGGVITFVDITERQHAQNALKAAHAESELFINSIPSILIGLDAQGRIIRWNSAAEKMFDLKGLDVLGKPLATCGIAWAVGDMEERIRSMLTLEGQTKWEDISFQKNGMPRLLGLTTAMIGPPDTETVMFLVVGADITGRRLAEEDLRFKTAFLEAQTNASPDSIVVVNESGQTLLQNRKFAEMFNIPQSICDKADENSLLDHLLPEIKNPDEFMKHIQFIYSHPNETILDEVEFKNGRVFDRYSSPVIDANGTHYGRIWTFREITERKQNEEAMRQLSLAVEQSPVSVVITDLGGNITYVNRRFSESSGYTAGEVLGKNPRILKSDHTSPEEYKEMWQAITAGSEWRGEFRNKRKNGESYWESIIISPIKDTHGDPTHFLAFKEDITDRRNMEVQLAQTQKLEAIGQLAAGIAHEINTPIQFVGDNTRFIKESWASLDPAISILKAFNGDSSQADACKDLHWQLHHALQSIDLDFLRQEIPQALDQSLEGIGRVTMIVRAMKDFSHPGSDEKLPADINKAILTTVTVARNEWKYASNVETFLEDNLEWVPCHLGEFNQVILNLIVNSAHAISQVVGDGSRGKGTITIRTKQDDDWLIISIQDTGAGIPAEIHSRIFEPFFTTKGVGKGTGQGLAMAHNTIVKRHQGRLWFESELSKGTTFYIQLPRTKKAG